MEDSRRHRSANGGESTSWWSSSSTPPPPPATVIDENTRTRNRARRRRSICFVIVVLAICGAVAAILLPTTMASRTNVVSAATDGTTTDGEEGGGGGGENERTCNGLASNCYRKVNEIMYATLHNAMASLSDQFVVAYNHLYSLEDALEMGFRGLMMDTCECTAIGTQLCHSTCAIGFRSPVAVFTGIRDFLNANENEIVILELQIGEGTFEPLYDKMREVENLTSLVYEHPNRTAPWPIINDLIANNTRLIIFQHDGPDCNAGMCPPGFHNTYEFVMETTWNATGVEGLMNFNETCVRTRGRKRSAFMLSNHFATNSLGLPLKEIAEEVNLAENIRSRTDACTEMLGRNTNLLAVDYWSVGDTLAVVQEYNELLPAISEAPSMSPIPSASPSSRPSVSSSPSVQPSAIPTTREPTLAAAVEEPTRVNIVSSSPSFNAALPESESEPESMAPSGLMIDSTSMPTAPSLSG